MNFKPKFECLCARVDGTAVSLGLYDTYEEAVSAAFNYSATDLPNECVRSFQIVKVYCNTNVDWTTKI